MDGAQEERSPAPSCQQLGMELLLRLMRAVCASGSYKICCARRAHSLWGRMVAAMLQSSTSIFVVPGSWNVTLLLRCGGNILLSRPFCEVRSWIKAVLLPRDNLEVWQV